MKYINKVLSILLSLIMVFGVFTIIPFEAFAATEIEYIYRSWDETNEKVVDEIRTCSSYTTITSQSNLTLEGGNWYVVNGNADINNRVKINGEAHLILKSGTLTCKDGIRLSRGNALYIYSAKDSSGTLNAMTGDDEEANIGGNEKENCGKLVFYGGKLKAENNDKWTGAAVIGGGSDGGNCGSLSFYGGTVEAYHFDSPNNSMKYCYGSVIGNGNDSNSRDDSYCSINIYGGDITAKNSVRADGAGIGGGENSKDCPINILGGNITARSYNGAGIGSGQDGSSSTVTIKNAVVKAQSDCGAGVGSGEDSNSKSIIIENSYVKAETTTNSGGMGAEGAGIGGGNCGKSEYIKISKSIIIASSGRYGAGIGGGDESDGGVIEITDSNVFAHSAQGGAGIGGGDEKGCDSITLKNSFVTAITDSEINTAAEKFISSFGGNYNTISAAITNPAVSNQAGFYAAGQLTAMVLAYLIQGTHTGAGIGSGDSGNVNNIFIDNCTVLATGGDCAAGIGGGDEGGFGTIDIKNSNIYAEGSKYGAGIGTGDEAEKCGTITINDSDVTARAGTDAAGIGTGNEADETAKINISNSTVNAHGGRYGAGIGGGDDVSGGNITISNSVVTADSQTDAAGIGGGESGDGGTIKILDGSDVTATGGGYGAGIGGGDSGDGGNITISNSTVKAYGGTDGAGIGGGEDGDGGHIEIYDSNVYAKGKDYGAGIGGGEDGSGDYCGIFGSSTVEAVSGGDGNVQSIGHGDCGWYVSYTDGTLSLDDSLTVKVGSDTYYNSSRFDAIRKNKSVVISPCSHPRTTWRSVNNLEHAQFCDLCGEQVGRRDNHTWNSNNVCTVCGALSEYETITLVEQDNIGEVRRSIQALKKSNYRLTEPENIPDGMEFVCWASPYSSGGNTYHLYRSPDGWYDEIEIGDGHTTWYAWYLPVVDASYIDENGIERTVKARELSGSMPYSHLTAGWYYVSDDTEFAKDYFDLLELDGDVRLIIADGKNMRYANEDITTTFTGSNLTVYGQSAQTGTLDCTGKGTNDFRTFTQVGGNTLIGANMGARNLVIQGGSLYAKYYSLTMTVTGGNVRINRLYLSNRNNKQIGWTKLTDSVRFDDIERINPSFTGTITVAEGQAFMDEDGNIYTGALTDDQLNAIKGKTLIPYIEHDYAEPEWVWANEYTDATAVFRCKDCDDTQEVKAKVTTEDSGKNRTSTARCIFNGQEYSTTQTFQIIFDVMVANAAHGTVSSNKATARADENIKLAITTDNGYALSKLYYTDSKGNKTAIDDSSFTMPESDVTVYAEFIPIIPATKPYIDKDGEYHLGNIKYVEVDGEPYSVTEEGKIGEKLDSVELSYFDFQELSNGTYQILHYTGPYDGLDELVIPKTFNGKKITVLGDGVNNAGFMSATGYKKQFTLKLNENIAEIKPYAFYAIWVSKVDGDTSNLKTIGEYAFSWANSPDGYMLDIKLDYEGTITVERGIFNNITVTARIKHATAFSRSNYMQKEISYIFTDAHIYGEPEWTWADDYSSAAATFTCTDSRCKHQETIDAAVTGEKQTGKITHTATVVFEGETYTDTKEADRKYFAGHSLTLSGDIGVNFYVDLTDQDIADGAVVDFVWTVNGTDKTSSVTLNADDKYSCGYKATCNVAVAEMTYEITATLSIGGTAVETDTYSVKEYADIILSSDKFGTQYIAEKGEEKYNQLVTLVKTMLDYGSKAQIVFERNTDSLANGGTDYFTNTVNASDITSTMSNMTDNLSAYGLEYTGSSIVYLTETSIRHYYKITNQNAFDAVKDDITFDGVKVSYIKKGGEIYFEKKNVAAADLDKAYTLTIGADSYDYAVLDYVKRCLESDKVKAETKALASATYRYNQAANTYFGE